MQKSISNFSCPVQLYWISQFCSKYFAQDCRNMEIRKKTVWILPNIWGLAQVMIPNLARMSLVEYYWKLQNARGYRIYRFWVIKAKSTGGRVTLPPATIQVKVQVAYFFYDLIMFNLRESTRENWETCFLLSQLC